MILTADSGSTKTTWTLAGSNTDNGNADDKLFFNTQGITPFHMSEETMARIISDELLTDCRFPSADAITEVYFYGAGCTKEKRPLLKAILQTTFPNAYTIDVDSDMLGAAKALFANEEGIACILGTGANSCLYDGKKIVANVSPMGYILGDEGSGAVLGKTFINLLYKGVHRDFIGIFEKETGLSQADIINRVYREPLPNRFLASLAPFIKKHISEAWIDEMVTECFCLFFKRNICHYDRKDLPCAFVGSIAYFFEDQLRKAATKKGFSIKKIMKEPLA